MNSCIYEGTVRHQRLQPKRHTFSYRVFMMYLDLDELDHVFNGSWFWSTDGFNLAQFRREDHAGPSSRSLRQHIGHLVEEKTGKALPGPIRVLTNLRYFGYCFNPVSFYYCFDAQDKQLEAIVAEVNNTPWNEQHCYVLDQSMNQGDELRPRFRFAKDFHVSPFMAMDLNYDWRFKAPGETLGVKMENLRGGERFFNATMTLRRRQIHSFSLTSLLIRYPFMTARVIGAIHWNALLLWIKGCPIYTHPEKGRDIKVNAS